MTNTTKTRGTLLAILALLLAAAMAAANLAAPSVAQAASGKANPSKECSDDTLFGQPSTHGGCTSYVATGSPTGAGYSAQCKAVTGGEYPFTFYEGVEGLETTVGNPAECKDALRAFHAMFPE